jgi:hypothetical protein
MSKRDLHVELYVPHCIASQVRDYLESVFLANTHPEDLVKSKLHDLLGLEMRQINDWFHNRQAPLDYTDICSN